MATGRAASRAGQIRVGIGGWTFPPWRGPFYPSSLPRAEELSFASRRMTAIEVNGTFYRTQTPDSFARWAAETPDDFVFAIKAARAATYRADPAQAAPSVEHFLNSGLDRLGRKLGPVIWQFPPTRRFDPQTMAAFLRLLPPALNGLRLRHVVEALHPSFADPAWIAMLAQHGVVPAIVERDAPPLADVTADFIYARLERNSAAAPDGYAEGGLAAWAARLQIWSQGGAVTDLPRVVRDAPPAQKRDCFVFFISGDKVRAPDAAQAMLARLQTEPTRQPAVETSAA